MKYAKDGFQVRAARKKRRPLPPWYLAEPALPPGVEWFMDAYLDLSTCRPPGGAIPWSACALYGQHKGLAPDVLDLLWGVVSKMDITERSWVAEQTRQHGTGAG